MELSDADFMLCRDLCLSLFELLLELSDPIITGDTDIEELLIRDLL